MTDWMDMYCEMLPLHSQIQKENNQLRKVLDRTIGEYMEAQDDILDELFLETATGGWLDAHGRDYGVKRRLDESDDSYRERIIFEKLEYLTAHNLQEIYNATLYAFVDEFDAKDNTLTSDNVYLQNISMIETTSDIENILQKKFVLGDNVIFLHDNQIDAYQNLTAEVIWDDNGDLDGNRPTSATVTLRLGNTLLDTATVTSSTNWKCVFQNYPVYDPNGQKYHYSINVDVVTDYTISVDGLIAKMKYTPEMQTLTVVKVWDDNNDEHEVRPSSINAMVSANNNNYGEITVTSEDNWTNSIDVPKRLNKSTASYLWTERQIPNYQLLSRETTGNTTTLTNKYYVRPETPTIE